MHPTVIGDCTNVGRCVWTCTALLAALLRLCPSNGQHHLHHTHVLAERGISGQVICADFSDFFFLSYFLLGLYLSRSTPHGPYWSTLATLPVQPVYTHISILHRWNYNIMYSRGTVHITYLRLQLHTGKAGGQVT